MEKQLEQLELMYPNKARGIAKFNVPLAHMITAGADFMLIPSRFEPCGLIQLHAMRYGTVFTFNTNRKCSSRYASLRRLYKYCNGLCRYPLLLQQEGLLTR